jgi:hypothetical protein
VADTDAVNLAAGVAGDGEGVGGGVEMDAAGKTFGEEEVR